MRLSANAFEHEAEALRDRPTRMVAHSAKELDAIELALLEQVLERPSGDAGHDTFLYEIASQPIPHFGIPILGMDVPNDEASSETITRPYPGVKTVARPLLLGEFVHELSRMRELSYRR